MIFRFHLIWKTKIGGMMIKDFWLFVRRKGQILVVTMFSLILAVIVLIFANALARSKEPIYPVFAFCTQVVIYSVMLGSAMTWGGFRSEVWWFLRTHPISAKLIFASKSAVACVLSGGYAFFWITLILLIAKLPIRSILLINAIAIASIFASTIFNTAIGTLPWICEAEPQNKRPILRIWTIVLTVILNLILSIGSMIFWQVTALGELDLRLSSNVIELIVSIAIFSVLGVVSLISYFFGVRNLRKLLH